MTFDTSMLNTLADLVGGMFVAMATIGGIWALATLAFNFFGERDGSAMKSALSWAAGAGLLASAGGLLIALW